MEKFKIVADSSADLLSIDSVPFAYASLKIITAEKQYIDDADLDVKDMVETLSTYKGKSSTSCPNPEDWLRAFGDAESVFCLTLTGTLSGGYNSAMLAKRLYEEKYPGRRVFVINSLSTGPEMKLIAEYIREMILNNESYENICGRATQYMQNTGLLFMLESMRNLANNGRISSVVAKAVGLLGIRIVGTASEMGDLQLLDKCRGQQKALEAMFNRMKEFGYEGGRVRLAHCFNEKAAEILRDMILTEYPTADIEVYTCRGLCGFYAEKNGMLVGFEKNI